MLGDGIVVAVVVQHPELVGGGDSGDQEAHGLDAVGDAGGGDELSLGADGARGSLGGEGACSRALRRPVVSAKPFSSRAL